MAIQDSAIGPQDFRVVKDLTARDAVTPKKIGMVVYVQSDATYYKWTSLGWDYFFTPVNMSTIVGLHRTELRVISSSESLAMELTLLAVPSSPTEVVVMTVGGTVQKYGTDYVVSGNVVSWNGYGMETIIESGDMLVIIYIL